jgi:hypothetical protein
MLQHEAAIFGTDEQNQDSYLYIPILPRFIKIAQILVN